MPFWEYNVSLFRIVNDLSSHPLIAKISPILADGPIFFLPLFLVFLWLYHTFKQKSIEKKIELMFLFYCAAIAHFISLTIQLFVDIERPETAIANSGKLLLEHIPDGSFPSDHASVSVAFLTGLCFLGYKKVFYAFMPWVILMLLCRVIVGVHWPFDIIAGTMIGVIS
jgi:undecaprenyl-diphosphatase